MKQTDLDLPYEDYFEALRDDVRALGGPKVVGKWFWQEKEPEAARNALNDRLNATRRERLSDEQERLIMRRAREVRGFSAALNFICRDAGFDNPRPRNPAEELSEVMARAEHLARESRAVAAALERLSQPSLHSIK